MIITISKLYFVFLTRQELESPMFQNASILLQTKKVKYPLNKKLTPARYEEIIKQKTYFRNLSRTDPSFERLTEIFKKHIKMRVQLNLLRKYKEFLSKRHY